MMGNFVSATGCAIFKNNVMSLDISVIAVLPVVLNTIQLNP